MPRVGMKLGYARCIAGEGGSVKRCRGLSRHPSNYSTDYSPELKMIRLFFLPLESEKRFSSRLERNWRFVARLSRMENASLRSYKDLCFAFDSNDNFLFSFFLFLRKKRDGRRLPRCFARTDGVSSRGRFEFVLCASRSPDLTRTLAHWGE